MQEKRRYLNDIYVCKELEIIKKILLLSNVNDLEKVVVLMERIEIFLRGKIKKYYVVIVQYMIILIICYVGMVL